MRNVLMGLALMFALSLPSVSAAQTVIPLHAPMSVEDPKPTLFDQLNKDLATDGQRARPGQAPEGASKPPTMKLLSVPLSGERPPSSPALDTLRGRTSP